MRSECFSHASTERILRACFDPDTNHIKSRRALFHVGADGFLLVGAAHQLHLFDGFGEQCRAGIDGQIVKHTLGGTDRLGTLAGDLARHLEGRRARVVADPRREAVAHSLLRGENPSRISQLAQDIVTHEAGEDRRARHVGHQSPFDLHDRHPRVGGEEAHVGAKRELEAAAKGDALNRRNHRHRKLPPAPHRLLGKIRQAMGARGKIALLATGYPVTPGLLHRGETPHIETRAERSSFAGQYYRSNSLFAGKPFCCSDNRLEHRGVERIHLVRPH